MHRNSPKHDEESSESSISEGPDSSSPPRHKQKLDMFMKNNHLEDES